MQRLVLVVDDNVPFRASLTRLIECYGYRTVTAGTVLEAIAALNPAPSHVLQDLNLPDGFGTEVLRYIGEHAMPIKVAILSGSHDLDLLGEAEALHPDLFLSKPPDLDRLLAWLAAD